MIKTDVLLSSVSFSHIKVL